MRVRPPRVVLDTNVIVSAALWGGKPGQLVALATKGQISLYTSRFFLNELQNTLNKLKLQDPIARTGFDRASIFRNYLELTNLVRVREVVALSRDPDDDHLIACALAARADFIVTGDDDLLVLGSVDGIRILRVAEVLGELV
jgi:uncharacterized protein